MIKTKIKEKWDHYKGSLGGVWEVWREKYSGISWHSVDLPHSYNALDAADPDHAYYQGQGWYKILLDIDNPYPEGRTMLHFEGAGQKTRVYVFCEEVACHTGGYDEFSVDITAALKKIDIPDRFKDKVPIAVACDNSRDLEMPPSDLADFHLYGGLYRNVYLTYLPRISLHRLFITPTAISAKNADIQVDAEIYNPEELDDKITLGVEIISPEGEKIAADSCILPPWKGSKRIAAFPLADPQLWSPDNPELYVCRTTLETEGESTEMLEQFGIRSFSFEKNGPFYLNGKRLLLRGTHRHEDHALVGPAMDTETTKKEMQMIKDMGANFIRLGHYQQSKEVIRLCDRLGLLVWEEIPWCRGGLGRERYRTVLTQMLESMIKTHYNHPSIIIWGLGNENDWPGDFQHFDQNTIRNFMQKLHDKAHSLDNTRLTGIRRCEFCKEVVDVYSPSIWAGWYRGTYPEYERYTEEGREKVERFLHLEWGADNIAGRHAERPYTGLSKIPKGEGAHEDDGDFLFEGGAPRVSKDGEWSESYCCELIDWHLKCQENMPDLTGTAHWLFKDFATPVRPDNPIPYINAKGVVERDLTPKEAYFLFQSYWTKKPMVHIHAHHAYVRWGQPNEPKQIKVFSNCNSVELFVNGKSLGKRQRNPNDFPAMGLRWNTVLMEGENEVNAVGQCKEHRVSDKTVINYQAEPWDSPETLTLSVIRSKRNRKTLQVLATDKKGVLCADSYAWVSYGIAGNGRLIDNKGTATGSRLVQMNNGSGLIDVELWGKAVVSAASENMKTAFLTIEEIKK